MSNSSAKKEVIVPNGFKEMLQEFTVAALREQPEDMYQFAIDYFTMKKMENDAGSCQSPLSGGGDTVNEENADEEDDILEDEPEPPPRPAGGRSRRIAVAGESYDPEKEDNYQKVVHEKTPEQRTRLTDVCKGILMFRCLDDDQMVDVIDAMFDRRVLPEEKVIIQGDDGDNFYVIDNGLYDIWVIINGTDTKVGSYDNKGSFGELALMYNTPRAATITATTEGLLWAMDRETFRCIVLKKAFQKRQMYEQLLEGVPLLKELNHYERMSIADALKTSIFSAGDRIIEQGQAGQEMYFIEDGKVRVTIKGEGSDEEKEVTTLEKGKYFGELALLTKHPRAASVYAVDRTKLAVLDVGSFERLLGPCLDIMQRNIGNYEEQLKEVFSGTNIPELRK